MREIDIMRYSIFEFEKTVFWKRRIRKLMCLVQ